MRIIAIAGALFVLGALAPSASADRVYHSEHLAFAAVAGAPLRSGFVENIKAEGPRIYAREIIVLNGAAPNRTYSVTRDFYVLNPACPGSVTGPKVATLTTNAAGNGRTSVLVRPEDVAGFEGVHGVRWSVRDATATALYRTECTAVTLD
jgi:hypothetical protein